MADSKRIGAKIFISGESEFRQALNNAKASTKEFKSELEKLVTEFGKEEKSLDSLRKKQEIYQKEQASLEQTTRIIAKRIGEANEARDKEAASLDESREKLSKLQDKLEQAVAKYGEGSKQVEKLSSEIENCEDKIRKQESALEKLDTQISGYNTDLNKTETELNKVQKELDQTNRELQESEKMFTVSGRAAEIFEKGAKKAGEKIQGFNESFKNFVTMTASNLVSDAIRGIGRGLADMATGAIEIGRTFETSMSTVAATMSLTEREIATVSGRYKILEDSARAMGAATKYSASEAADALNYLALAGYDATKAAQALPTVLNLAAAGAMDLGYASDLVTDSMSALGLSMDDLEGFTDQMAVTAQKSNTNVSQLGEAILKVGGTAKQLVGGTVELSTALGILADNGIKGAEGGIALRNVLKNLLTPQGDKAVQTFDRLNFSAYDANGNIRPLNETLKELAWKLDGLSDQERNEIMSKIFDVRNLKSAEALMANAGKRFDELSNYIANADGAAARMAYTMSNNLTGQMKTFQSATEELGISVYKKLETPLKNAVETGVSGIRTLTNQVNNGRLGSSLDKLGETIEDLAKRGLEIATEALPKLIDGTSWLVDNLGSVVTAVKGLITAYLTYEVTTKAVTLATELFNLTLSATPIGLVTAAVSGLIVVVSSLSSEMNSTSDEISNEIRALQDANEQIDRSVSSGKDLVTELENQKQYTAELVDELDELNRKEELNDQEKRRIREIVGILNGQYQGLNITIDDATGKTVENTDAIRKNIEELRNQIAVQSMYDKIGEIQKANADAAYELWKAEKELDEVETQLETTRKQLREETEKNKKTMDEAAGAAGMETTAMMELESKVQDLSVKKTNLNETISQLSEKTKEAEETEKEFCQYMETELGVTFETIDAENKLAESMASTSDAAGDLTGDVEDLEEEMNGLTDSTNAAKDAFAKFMEDYSKSIQSGLQSATDLFSEFKEAEAQDIGAMQENVRGHIDGIMEWRDSYKELADKVGTSADEVLTYLAGMGVDGKGYIDAMLSLSDEELGSFVADMENALTLPDHVTADIVNSYIDVSNSIITGLTGSLQDEAKATGRIDIATTAVSKRLTDTIAERLAINNYRSGVLYDDGIVIAKKIATGMEDGKNEPVKAAETVTDAIDRTVQTDLSKDTLKDAGKQVDAGLAEGIREDENLVYNAIRQLCTKAVNEARNDLQISSPSRVFEEIGEFTVQGFVKGWDSTADEMVSAVNTTIQDTVSAGRVEGNSYNTTYGSPTINVYGAAGQDVNELAEIVNQKLCFFYQRQAGARA